MMGKSALTPAELKLLNFVLKHGNECICKYPDEMDRESWEKWRKRRATLRDLLDAAGAEDCKWCSS